MSTCGVVVASCVCVLTDDHEVHVCSCGGSWTGDNNNFDPVTFPGGTPVTPEGFFSLIQEILERA